MVLAEHPNRSEADVEMLLTDRTQSAVHRLLLAEQEPGALLPSSAVEPLGRLIGCDWWGVGEADGTGYGLRVVEFPREDRGRDPQWCDGPLPTGLQHDASKPADDRDAAEFGLCDLMRLGFSTGSGTVTMLHFARRLRYFSESDVALLAMLEPAIGRLVRRSSTQAPGVSLTPSERQVLALVAQGCSNREIAEDLYVTVHTVRKHLEHAYRKLGVQNRTAAALRFSFPP